MKRQQRGIYERRIKRIVDIFCALAAIVFFGWLYIIIAILVRIKLGSPVIFTQKRPGLKEEIFQLYKFRTMTEERDAEGNLMPDSVRLTKFGRWLRATSLDELPEAFNILKGEMSVVGPRPQLVKDMVFMSEEQRKRHLVKPGLSGLAQVNGRNAISWEKKLEYDLEYIEQITFWGDVKIVLKTVGKAFIKKEGIHEEDMTTASDFGDYLLEKDLINQEQYRAGQEEAKRLLQIG